MLQPMKKSLLWVVQRDQMAKLIHTSPVALKASAGRYKITPKRDKPLTYEMANPPHYIAHRKSWNSWNCSTLDGGLRTSETAIEEIFIRKFMIGTFHNMLCSEVIIKRQFNHIRIAAILSRRIAPNKMCFLIGYTEEMLSIWLQCPVTLEIQTISSPEETIFKYV